MTTYRPTTPHSNSISRLNCSKCGTATLLFGIEPEKPGHELRSFDCPKCNHIETVIGKSEAALVGSL